MKLDIILRIHDGKNIHGNFPRYIDIPKKDLIFGCVSSLINAANNTINTEINFIVLNDHCTNGCISTINSIFKFSKHPYQIIDLKISGFHYSGLKQFEYCKNSEADLVYSVEDDYLHHIDAIKEMLFSYQYLKSYYHLKKELCIYPFDNKQDYEIEYISSGRLFRTPTRHWKEGIHTTFTMMTSPKIFQQHWTIFEKLASNYTTSKIAKEKNEIIIESNTISNIWKNHVVRVNPIPSVALHVQFDEQKDPHIDHLEWWYKYSKIKSSCAKYFYS